MAHRPLLAARAAALVLALVFAGFASAEPGPPTASVVSVATDPATESSAEIPLLDPFLSEVGPILPDPGPDPAPQAATGPDRVVQAWRTAAPTPHARAAALRRLRLELGLGDLRGPAHAIRAAVDPDDPETGTALARVLAPNMPALRWNQVQDLWRAGAIGEAVRAFGEVLASVARDLESQLWLIGNGLLLAWLVALAATSAFIGLLAVKAFSHAAHDLGDPLSRAMPAFARAALLAGLMLIPLALGEGIAGLVLACFAVAFMHGTPRERSALILAAIAFGVAIHPLARWASIAATVSELDPVVDGVWAVTRGTALHADLERLESAAEKDVAAAHALAYRARRFGQPEVAARQLEALERTHPTDPVVLANRGNVEMRAGQTEAAIRLYERAAALLESPTLLFDLSQAYSRTLRMEESELALVRAQRIADAEVAALSSLSDPNLVADLEYPDALLRARIKEAATTSSPAMALAQQLAPGRIGESWQMAAACFGAAVLVGLMSAGRFERSRSCARCGRRVCGRCDERVRSDSLCEDCHHLFKNPDATDPRLRMARLQVLARREAWQARLVDLGSILVPGVAGLAIRRPDVALLSIVSCAYLAACLRWPAGLLLDSTWLGVLAPLFTSTLGVLALATHAAIVVGCLAVRRNR